MVGALQFVETVSPLRTSSSAMTEIVYSWTVATNVNLIVRKIVLIALLDSAWSVRLAMS